VYLCGRSMDGGNFRFGTVVELTASALRSHPLRQQLHNRCVYLRRTFCRSCRWWLYCHGGCINDGVVGNGTPFAPTSLCAGLRHFFEQAFGAEIRERAACGA
jgi:radical SAM protein with 4Fe4S-binding SPASM domain